MPQLRTNLAACGSGKMCQEMFGFPVSEATLQKARQEHYDALEPFEDRLREILPQEKILHADETSLPINKADHWLRVVCTPLLTFFSVQSPHSGATDAKAAQAIQRTELVGSAQGL